MAAPTLSRAFFLHGQHPARPIAHTTSSCPRDGSNDARLQRRGDGTADTWISRHDTITGGYALAGAEPDEGSGAAATPSC